MVSSDIPDASGQPLGTAVPFWLSLGLVPLVWLGAFWGGWWLLLPIVATWHLYSALDFALGLNAQNADPQTGDDALYWHKMVTLIWVPLQFVSLFGLIAYVTRVHHLGLSEQFGVFLGVGVMTGTIGINFSHELMHQKNRVERWCGDILLAMVLYSHFRSEHLLVHHRYIGTPRDPVTARFNEPFYRYFPRVVAQCFRSAWAAEAAMLARQSRPATHRINPFWRYAALQMVMLLLAFGLGGWMGVTLFIFQAVFAVWQLELVNYVEHYGLTRKHLGGGRYEHVLPRHSWNAAHTASNWLLINLQRHSDHHYRPDRRFPLLQTHDEDSAPQLPFGYPLMTMAAMVPSLWRRTMNPRVHVWRKRYYPEITDWSAYNAASNPMPR